MPCSVVRRPRTARRNWPSRRVFFATAVAPSSMSASGTITTPSSPTTRFPGATVTLCATTFPLPLMSRGSAPRHSTGNPRLRMTLRSRAYPSTTAPAPMQAVESSSPHREASGNPPEAPTQTSPCRLRRGPAAIPRRARPESGRSPPPAPEKRSPPVPDRVREERNPGPRTVGGIRRRRARRI